MPGVDDGDAREAIQVFPAVDIRYGATDLRKPVIT
jgi:hypothetical protein